MTSLEPLHEEVAELQFSPDQFTITLGATQLLAFVYAATCLRKNITLLFPVLGFCLEDLLTRSGDWSLIGENVWIGNCLQSVGSLRGDWDCHNCLVFLEIFILFTVNTCTILCL